MNTKIIDRKQTVNAVVFAAMLGWCLGGSENAFADAHCFCKISCANLTNSTTATMVIKDYGTLATYTGLNQQSDSNQTACNTKCTDTAKVDILDPAKRQGIANLACAAHCPNGSNVNAWSAVGTKEYKTAGPFGTLVNTPAVTKTTYDCNGLPGTWLDNPSSGNGGHARCVKNSANAVQGVPIAPPWTSIGTSWQTATGPAWITDGSGNIWYGVPAHATVTVVTAAQCHF